MEIPTLILSDAERNGPLLDSFAVDELIGEGSYGHVYRGTHLRTAGTVAVKRVPIDNDLPSLMQEISMMQACDSPAIVQLHHFYVEPHYLWMVMEFCAAGSVADVMKATGRTLSEPIIAVIARDTLLGLSYLHSHGKLHRDIKAGNILLDDEGRGKLADFGVAGQLTDAATRRNTIIGTPYWMAPEVIQEIGYTTKADLWSLGITCIEMAEGHPPNHAVHPMRAIFMIPSRPPPRLAAADQWTPDFHAFLALLLIKNPDVRPTADTVLDDPFISRATDHTDVRDLARAAGTLREIERLERAARGTESSSRSSLDDVHGGEESATVASDTIRGPLDMATMRPSRSAGGGGGGNGGGRMHLVLEDVSRIPSSSDTDDAALDELVEATGTMIIRRSSDDDMPFVSTSTTSNGPAAMALYDTGTVVRPPIFPAALSISDAGTIKPLTSASIMAATAAALATSPAVLTARPFAANGTSLDRMPATYPLEPETDNGGFSAPSGHSLAPSTSQSALRPMAAATVISGGGPERPERSNARRSPSGTRSRPSPSPSASPNPGPRAIPATGPISSTSSARSVSPHYVPMTHQHQPQLAPLSSGRGGDPVMAGHRPPSPASALMPHMGGARRPSRDRPPQSHLQPQQGGGGGMVHTQSAPNLAGSSGLAPTSSGYTGGPMSSPLANSGGGGPPAVPFMSGRRRRSEDPPRSAFSSHDAAAAAGAHQQYPQYQHYQQQPLQHGYGGPDGGGYFAGPPPASSGAPTYGYSDADVGFGGPPYPPPRSATPGGTPYQGGGNGYTNNGGGFAAPPPPAPSSHRYYLPPSPGPSPPQHVPYRVRHGSSPHVFGYTPSGQPLRPVSPAPVAGSPYSAGGGGGPASGYTYPQQPPMPDEYMPPHQQSPSMTRSGSTGPGAPVAPPVVFEKRTESLVNLQAVKASGRTPQPAARVLAGAGPVGGLPPPPPLSPAPLSSSSAVIGMHPAHLRRAGSQSSLGAPVGVATTTMAATDPYYRPPMYAPPLPGTPGGSLSRPEWSEWPHPQQQQQQQQQPSMDRYPPPRQRTRSASRDRGPEY